MRVWKKIGIVFLLGFLIFSCFVLNAFFGNPVSKILAKNAAEKHLSEKYSDSDFYIGEVGYSFKDGHYYVYIYSESSADSSFSLEFSQSGKLFMDYYDSCVTERGNTARRVRDEYRSNVEKILNKEDFPYKVDIGFGDVEFYSRKETEEYSIPDHALISDDLILDGVYDVNELGAKAGVLTVYIEDDEVTVESLSEILLDIKRIFDDGGVKFYIIDCVLESSKNDERVEVMDFLYTDIYEEDLIERVRASDKAAKEYYEIQNLEKLNESAQ